MAETSEDSCALDELFERFHEEEHIAVTKTIILQNVHSDYTLDDLKIQMGSIMQQEITGETNFYI